MQAFWYNYIRVYTEVLIINIPRWYIDQGSRCIHPTLIDVYMKY